MKTIFITLFSAVSFIGCVPPPHPAVVAVRHQEEQLPYHLRKPALNNPHLQSVLPLSSVLHHGEMPVYQREADKVPRQKIYNILVHAGFISRQPYYNQPLQHLDYHIPPPVQIRKHPIHLVTPYDEFSLPSDILQFL